MSSPSSDPRGDSADEDEDRSSSTTGTSVQGSEYTESPTPRLRTTTVRGIHGGTNTDVSDLEAWPPLTRTGESTLTARARSVASSTTASSVDLRSSDLAARLLPLGPSSDHGSSISSASSGRVRAGRERVDMTALDVLGLPVGTVTVAAGRPARAMGSEPLRETSWAGERALQSAAPPARATQRTRPTFVPPSATSSVPTAIASAAPATASVHPHRSPSIAAPTNAVAPTTTVTAAPAASTMPTHAGVPAPVNAGLATASAAPPPESAAPVTIMAPHPPALDTTAVPVATGTPPPETPGSEHSHGSQEQDHTRTSQRTDASWQSEETSSVVAQSLVLDPPTNEANAHGDLQHAEGVDEHAPAGGPAPEAGREGAEAGTGNNEQGRIPSPASDDSQGSRSRRRREHRAGGSRRNSDTAGPGAGRASPNPSRLERQFKEHMEDNSASSNKILSKLTTIEDNTNELIKHTKGIRKSARGARILLRNLNYNTKLTRASINVGGSQIREAVLENTQVQRASQTRLEQMFQRSEDNNRAQQQRTEEMWSAFLQRMGEPLAARSGPTPRPPAEHHDPSHTSAPAGTESPIALAPTSESPVTPAPASKSPVTPVDASASPVTPVPISRAPPPFVDARVDDDDWQDESSTDTLHNNSQDEGGQSTDERSSGGSDNDASSQTGPQDKGKAREE